MVPSLVASYVIAYLLGVLLTILLDVPEGELLSTAGVRGRLAAVLVLVVMVIPPVAGVVLAARALRGGAPARAPLAVNGVLLLYLLVVSITQLAVGDPG
ncbi:MAG: hypothetical protein ACFCVG_11825 [Kineosporiaceae bacterium]